MEKLKPCPCCSAQARYVAKFKNNEVGTDYYGKSPNGGKITCSGCGLTIQKSKHVELVWNTRVVNSEAE